MATTLKKRCIICGRPFEVKVLDERPMVEELFPAPPERSSSICPLCEARIKKEAGDTQKEPKSM